MNIEELTLKNLITDRPDLVDSILIGEHKGIVTYSVEKDKDGKMTKWTEEKKDIDEILVSKRVDDYTYFENGDVDQISLKRYDDKGVMTLEKVVRHKESKEIKEPKK